MCRFIETIRIKDGVAENLPAHNRRMNITRKVHFHSEEELCLEDFIDASGYTGLTRCRVVYSDRIEKVEYLPYTIREVRTLKLVTDDEAEYSFKREDRSVLDRNFYLRDDADDVIIVRHGLLTDTSIANIALYRDGHWYTPRSPLLKGTRRMSLLQGGMILEADIKASDLLLYDRIRIFNAMIGFGDIELKVSDAFLLDI